MSPIRISLTSQPYSTWASLKIKRASRSTENLDEDPEIRSMKALEKHYICGAQDRSRRFLRLLDTFHHEAPNGIHSCLVMELLGPSLSSVLRRNGRAGGEYLAPDTILRSSQQLLEGIQFAHDAGISHGGINIHSSHSVRRLYPADIWLK
jgi:serine/threonine-protein kinase SRPK3